MNESLREMLQNDPFTPFKLSLSNGQSYVVRQPKQVMLLPFRFIVFKPKSERFRVCDFEEITQLQPLPKRKTKT